LAGKPTDTDGFVVEDMVWAGQGMRLDIWEVWSRLNPLTTPPGMSFKTKIRSLGTQTDWGGVAHADQEERLAKG
jgi:hypothetical protein